MQPFALNAFNKALELDNESPDHVVQVNQQKGYCDSNLRLHLDCIIFDECNPNELLILLIICRNFTEDDGSSTGSDIGI